MGANWTAVQNGDGYQLFNGWVCQPCLDSIRTGIRAWCAAPPPRPETPEHLTPTPKSAYVMDPKGSWMLAAAVGVLLSLLSVGVGAWGAWMLRH